ncbi:diaminopimelate decarboxylase [Rapidithrix thailandica]|uniref:Diaminopimelate decarboxylase n=1 Tax=Rapidithrix thailandica TaxID=413964 RepID=A0AAW9S6G6_9BACT
MRLVDGKYQVQGLDLVSICEEFGTPLYVYNADKIISQIQRLKQAFQGTNMKLKYACKALTNLNILKLIKQQGVELDVVSIEEAQLGILAGYKPEEILFTPNGVAFDEIKLAVELGLTVNIDNISILEQFGHHYGNSVPCCIRINPHIVAGGNSKIQVGHIDSKFGISVHQLPHIRRVVEANKIKVIGLHMHSGSDILESEVFLRAAEVLFNATEGFEDLEFVDLGSGFKVAYREGDITTNIEELGQEMAVAFNNFCKRYGKDLELWFEPGKFLVSESGVLLTKANVIKHTPSAVFVGVDSGLNHLVRPMMYDSYHEIVNLSNPEGTKRIYNVVGYICETDTFGCDRKINEVREGDILAMKNAGAYGYSMSSNYNSRLRPPEVLIYNHEAKLIRERETLDDLVRHQVDIFSTPKTKKEKGKKEVEKVS